MEPRLEDRLRIAALMTGWIHRDLGQWDQLRQLFHPDGVIEVSWFEGSACAFVDASMRMGASDLKTKHLIAAPVVDFNGDKAVAETNAMIIAENTRLHLGTVAHNRLYDLLEKHEGIWKIVKRQAIYDMGYLTFPRGFVEIDVDTVRRYPREYASLGYLLEKSGFPVKRVFATKGSEQESSMKAAGQKWLFA
jgi:hypothetical protein